MGITMPRDYKAELQSLSAQQDTIIADRDKERGNKKFKCVVCDKLHTISKCDAFTFPTWESGRGYDDDRWWEGEIYIRCPETQSYNRCLFSSPPYGHYSDYDYNADIQFKRIYKSLFKSFIQGEDNKKLNYNMWYNNHYFDQNHKKFDIHVKGVDN